MTATPQQYASPAVALALFTGALATALFFNGVRIDLFALALVFLVLWLGQVAWQGYDTGFPVPKTPLVLCLLLFWLWLAVSLAWSRVPYVSVINFWWVGSLPLVFWLYTLAPDRDRLWPWLSGVVGLTAIILALVALYQLFVLEVDPRSAFLNRNSHAAFLTLVTVPIAARFLLLNAKRQVLNYWLTLAALSVLLFAIAITGGRGVTLSGLIAVGIVVLVARRHVPKQRIITLLAVMVGVYILANVQLHGFVAERLGSIFNPASAGHDRFLIWEGAWRMLMDAPWLGIGLGTYWLFWPPYRHPADSSGGFFVHNDYLQIWIETGLPGLLLLLAVLVSVLYLFIRILKQPRLDASVKIEMAGLFGGLFAVALHSFVDFNFYTLPTLLVVGLILARLHSLYVTYTGVNVLVLNPSRIFGQRGYRLIAMLLLVLPLIYFSSLGFSALLTEKAKRLAAQGRWVEADSTFLRAARLLPLSDVALVTHADMIRQAMNNLPPSADKHKKVLFTETLNLLEQAERLNPVRTLIFMIRGQLYQYNPDVAGKDWAKHAARAYQTVLKLNPRFHPARTYYAQILLKQGKTAAAKAVLEAGINYWYYPGPNVIPYYALTAELRRRAGEQEAAAALEKRIDEIRRRAGPKPTYLESLTPPGTSD